MHSKAIPSWIHTLLATTALLGSSLAEAASTPMAPLKVDVPSVVPVLRLSVQPSPAQGVTRLALRAEEATTPAPSTTPAVPETRATAKPSAQTLDAQTLYTQALQLQSQGKLQEALAVYEQLQHEYPSAPEASAATTRVLELRDFLKQAPSPDQTTGTADTASSAKALEAKRTAGRAESALELIEYDGMAAGDGSH